MRLETSHKEAFLMRKTCWIVGAGDFSGPMPPVSDEDLVIAADAGYRTLLRLSARIDRVVGDFDSPGEVPVSQETMEGASGMREG